MVFAPALVGLGDFAFFLVCIIVVYALTFLVMALTGVLKYVPVVGPWIQSNLVSHVADALGAAAGWAVGGLGHAVGLIWTPITWLAALFARIGEALWEGGQAVGRVITHAIPAAGNAVQAFAQQLFHGAQAYTDRAEGQVADFATGLYHQAVNYTTTEVAQVELDAQQLYHQAIAYTAREAGAVADFATGLYHQALAFTQQEVGQLQGWVANTVTTVQQDVLGRISATESWVQGEVTALEGSIQDAYRAATGYADTVATAAAAPAIAAAGAVTLELEQYLSTCGRNLCAGLNPLSTALQALETVVEGGLLLALLAEAVRDAPGLGRQIEAVIGGTVRDTAAAVGAAIGAAA